MGHNSCAQAIEEYFQKQGVTCTTQDALTFISLRTAQLMSRGHSWIYRHAPGLFRWGYQYSEDHPAVFHEDSGIYRFLTVGAERLYTYIAENHFDTIICTHVFSAMILTRILKEHPMDIRTAFVATDYTCSPSTDQSDLEHYFIPDISLSEDYIKCGIPKDRISATGIPVRLAFEKYTERADAKRLLGICANHKHLLIMGGSMGCGPIRRIVQLLSRQIAEDMEVSVICGANSCLEKKLQKMCRKNSSIHVIGYTNQIPLYLDSADLYLTKPGGISVTEAARKNLPMIFVNAVAGCESYNMQFFLKKGAAVTADSPEKLVEECIRILHSPTTRTQMEKAMRGYHLPDGATTIFREINGGISA